MTQIHLTFSDETMARIRQRATECGCSSPELYVQNLIDDHLGERIDEELEALLLERVKGPFVEWTPEHAEKLQAQFLENLKNRAKT